MPSGHHPHRLTRAVAVAAAATALAAPSAIARPAAEAPGAATLADEPARAITAEPAAPAIDGGFDWISAAIGAAGGLVLLTSAGGFTYLSRHSNGIRITR